MFIILIVAQTFYKMRKKSRDQARYARNAERRVRDEALAEIDSNIAHDAERVAPEAARKEREEACEEPEAAEYVADLRRAVAYEEEIDDLSFKIACIKGCSARKEERSLRCVRRFIRAKLNIIKNFNKYKLVNRIDIAAKEYIKENPLQDNIHLTGTTFNNCTKNCFKSANHYDIKVAKNLSNLFVEAGVSQSNVIKAIHIMNKHFFKDTTKTIQYLRNLCLRGAEQSNFITPLEIMYHKADERNIQYFFPGILRKLNNWDSWDFELNCALDCTTYPNIKFLEIDTFFKRKCSKLVTKEDIKEFKEFKDNKLLATFLLVNQRLASTGKYVSISILDMLYLLKTYDNKLR